MKMLLMYQNQKWFLWDALLSTLSIKSSMKKLAATEGSGETIANLLFFLELAVEVENKDVSDMVERTQIVWWRGLT
jgi:hypothetical protein